MDLTKGKKITSEEAMRTISSCFMGRGEVDDKVVQKGAELIERGITFETEAFALFVMHLDPNSKHAPVYHRYAHDHFTERADWEALASLSRVGTPLRQIAADEDVFREFRGTRSGRVLAGTRYTEVYEVPHSAPQRIQHLLERLSKSMLLV